ncbi:MAG: hypothetical protein JNK23_00640 [Opitutaceae bacterium]|nr:hypothetical protein [Opitutaceae bacterium]
MPQRILEWVMGNLPIVIFAFVVIAQVLRAAKRAKEQAEDTPQARPDALEEHRRTREVQEQVRRRIAERRGGGAAATPPPVPVERPVARPETTQMPDVFDGPLGRMLQELQKRTEPPAPPVMAEVRGSHAGELERQERLAEELRALEESRAMAKRRAAAIVANQAAVAQTSSGQLHAARDRLLADLRSPGSLRRAVVLREVLGAPVALR